MFEKNELRVGKGSKGYGEENTSCAASYSDFDHGGDGAETI
jgi:hypothetical protein